MKWKAWSAVAITAIAFAGGYGASELRHRPQRQQLETAGTGQQAVTLCYRLRNAAVKDVADKLAASLEMSAAEIKTDLEANALTATAHPKVHEKISALLATLDARPLTVEIQCSLARRGPDASRTVLSKPQIQTLDGMEGWFSIGNAGESWEVTLVPTVILSEQEQAALRQVSFDTFNSRAQ